MATQVEFQGKCLIEERSFIGYGMWRETFCALPEPSLFEVPLNERKMKPIPLDAIRK